MKKILAFLAVAAAGCSTDVPVSSSNIVALNAMVNHGLPSAGPANPTLALYLCPDAATGCSIAAFKTNGVCRPISVVPGACVDTGTPLTPGLDVTIHPCVDSGCGTCSDFNNPEGITVTAPMILLEQRYFPGVYYYCSTPCEAPPSCP